MNFKYLQIISIIDECAQPLRLDGVAGLCGAVGKYSSAIRRGTVVDARQFEPGGTETIARDADSQISVVPDQVLPQLFASPRRFGAQMLVTWGGQLHQVVGFQFHEARAFSPYFDWSTTQKVRLVVQKFQGNQERWTFFSANHLVFATVWY